MKNLEIRRNRGEHEEPGFVKTKILNAIIQFNVLSEPELREYVRNELNIVEPKSTKLHLISLEKSGFIIKELRNGTNIWKASPKAITKESEIITLIQLYQEKQWLYNQIYHLGGK